MSVTIKSNAPFESKPSHEEPCLCSQMARCWLDAYDNGVQDHHRALLAEEAITDCDLCGGTGVETVNTMAPSINLANDNAVKVFAALGIQFDYTGELSIAEARRAVMRGRARRDYTPFTRQPEKTYGAPYQDASGVVQLRPLRVQTCGIGVDYILEKIELFAQFVEDEAARGATKILWF